MHFPGLWWCQHNVSVHINKGICMRHTVIYSGHGWASVTAFCRLFCHHQQCTTSRTVSIALLGPRPPPPTGDQCPLLWDPSYARIISHCVLWFLKMFPVGLTSLHWLHWYNMLMVPSRDVRRTIYMGLFHGEMHCPWYYMWDVLFPHSLKFPHINVTEVRCSKYATQSAITLSKTYKRDNDKAGHYDQMYKYGHIGKTVRQTLVLRD